MLKSKIKNFIQNFKKNKIEKEYQNKIKKYLTQGKIPWSLGYQEYKTEIIKSIIYDKKILDRFFKNEIPQQYGIGLDERIVEYAWIFANLKEKESKLLDAGSTFNFEYILKQDKLQNKNITIYTYYPESPNFNEKRISYQYGDLRYLPFRDNFFDEIVCQSTIEHIDMDNSIYGYDLKANQDVNQKSYEYLKVIEELLRILNYSGQLLLTFPYGKFENHGFFQQFDEEMINRIYVMMEKVGIVHTYFFKYIKSGWIYSNQIDCNTEESYNPHTNKGKKDDGAAHSRAICCIKFIKN